MQSDAHFCLISQQATPNLTPLLDQRFKPKKIVMLVSDQMSAQARYLSAFCKRRQIETETVLIHDPYDLSRIQDQVMDKLTEYEHKSVALNVTGGTKPMAIAAQQVFQMIGKPIFYVRIDTNEVIFLDKGYQPFTLDCRLKIKDYLEVHGYECMSAEDKIGNSSLSDFTKWLIEYAKANARAIGLLNALASEAENAKSLLVNVDKFESDSHFENLRHLIDQTQKPGRNLTLWQGKDLKFKDESSRFYLNGGWLENHVFEIVKDLDSSLIQDVAMNIKIKTPEWRQGEAENEIDVMILAKNRLHLIECKTKRFSQGSARVDEALYKLDSLSVLGGLNTRTMLVSYRDLHSSDTQRAKDLGIKIVKAEQLHGLKNKLNEWLKN